MKGLANVFVAMLRFGRRLVDKVLPPREWTVPVILTGGTFCGLGIAILHISNATSYLSDDPRACLNCHIMAPQFATWQRGSHARVATCNDCHVPHDNIFRKYFFKAKDGSRHAFMFTFHLEPQVIRVHEPGIRVIQENCMHCHEDVLHDTRLSVATGEMALHGEGKLCWDCHRETPHGSVNSLASVPHARVPFVSPVMPEWLTAFLEKKQTAGPGVNSGPTKNQ
jgi:cytochrome c nitrite reductase small subunit